MPAPTDTAIERRMRKRVAFMAREDSSPVAFTKGATCPGRAEIPDGQNLMRALMEKIPLFT
jgi:hypothetical protein